MVVSDQLSRFSMASEKEGKQKTSVKLIVVSVLCIYMCMLNYSVKHHSLKAHAFDLEKTKS